MQTLKADLSNREKEVLMLIAYEHTVHEIADKLYISSNTAHSHRKNLFRKLEVRNMAGLVRRGFELGLLKVPGWIPRPLLVREHP